MNDQHDQTTIGLPAIHLLKGILYRQQEEAWNLLLRYRGGLETYFAVLHLELIVDEADGYAYLRQRMPDSEDVTPSLPPLMNRRQLTYSLTLLLVLLRKRLLEFETVGNDNRLVLSQNDMLDMMRLYWADFDTNERKREDRLATDIKKLITYGFLKPLKSEKNHYAVDRILKAYVPIETLQEVLDKLRAYAAERGG